MKELLTKTEPVWDDSPCRICRATPCCRFLPITTVDPETEEDLAALTELLRLRYIELGLRDDGRWTVFYARPCGNLGEDSGACRVHGTDEQPPVCVSYDAKTCWYRGAFQTSANHGSIRFDHARMRWLADHTLFDDAGAIYRIPAWETMIEAFRDRNLPLPTGASDSRPASVEEDGGAASDLGARALQLRVPPGYPVRPADWALVKFRLAFPGVSLLQAGGEPGFGLDTEVAVDAPRLPTRLPSGITLVCLRRPDEPRPKPAMPRGA